VLLFAEMKKKDPGSMNDVNEMIFEKEISFKN
jgi:hypothetical protein